MDRRIRGALSRLGVAVKRPLRVHSDLSPVRPGSVAAILRASEGPGLDGWTVIGVSKAENAAFAHEAQGLTLAAGHWYVSANGDDDRDGLHKVSLDLTSSTRRLECPVGRSVHIGSPSHASGWIFVPTQTPFGVWRASIDFSRSTWLAASELPEDDMFAWCDIHPMNGLLYTSNFREPPALRAYDASGAGALKRIASADIPIVQPSLPAESLRLIDSATPGRQPEMLDRLRQRHFTTNVQSACFTANCRVLMICDVDHAERIHCHSALTGVLMDTRNLPADSADEAAFDRNELEGITLAPLTVNGRRAHVHVLELNNDNHSGDDLYLWHFNVPCPELL
ncbi:MAG: hypothetical protein H6713_29495 [Myxococcales bacterium]|nr:hypothetical protein [Myxococcales bacterium]MCB9754097.1 hypothetical protein [Myxococcales bacterium]